MSTKKGFKINQLLQSQPSGTVFLSSWLVQHGYSHATCYESTGKVTG
ncbi:AbiEi antitoxin N-terminal domain-containing protein [Flavivirga sp. 57AJ16]|nr:AbiEi antitoxin N-terminal domain-containing protein [Flavivirga sp. 57AJ16]MDD7886801.1 AbiEi antitoxin N-terminal domain-containing protein [Flavivirga sp. 57AJ16]